MKKFYNLLIRTKVLTIVVMNVFFYLFIMGIIYYSFIQIQEATGEIIRYNKAYSFNLIAEKNFDALRSDVQKALLNKNQYTRFSNDIKLDVKEHDLTLTTSFNNILALGFSDEVEGLMRNISLSTETYSQFVKNISTSLLSGDSIEVSRGVAHMREFQPTYDHLKVDMDKLNSYLEDQVNLAELSIENSRNKARMYILLVIVIAIGASIAFSLFVGNTVAVPVVDLKQKLERIASGDIPSKSKYLSHDEIGDMARGVNSLIDNLTNVKDFANEVGGGKFDTQIVVFNNEGVVGKSLAGMRESLKKVSEAEEIQKWSNTGITQVNEITRQNQFDAQQLYDKLIAFLVHYVNANQGGFYLVNKDNLLKVKIDLVCCYAYNKKKFITRSVPFGAGLVGQSIQEKDTLNYIDIPNDYIKIVSGLGGANPNSLLIVPLRTNDEVIGAIELASFHAFSEDEVKFIEKAAELVASIIVNVKVSTETQSLLQLSREQSEAMLSQDEEMRQNMEEMQASQEEVIRREAGYLARIKELEDALKVSKS